MTPEEMDAVKAITNIEAAEFSIHCIDVDEDKILNNEFNACLTTLRTWKARFRNGLTIRAARSDKGTPRT